MNKIKERLTWLVRGLHKPHPGSKSSPGRPFVTIVSIVVLLNLILTVFLVMEVTSLRVKTIEAFKNADGVMEALALKQILSEPGWIDPTSGEVQYIGFGLFVSDVRTAVSDGEIVMSGVIVNGTSVDHFDAQFTLFLEKGVQADFKIAAIRSGHSAPFAVKIKAGAGVEISEPPKLARLIYRGSVIKINTAYN